MDPQLAALMARRRRKADGVQSVHNRVTVPLEEADTGGGSETSVPPPPMMEETETFEPDSPPQKAPSQSSLKSTNSLYSPSLYSPSLLERSDKSGIKAMDKSNKVTSGMTMAPPLSKPKDASSSSPTGVATKEERPRLKREKSTAAEKVKNHQTTKISEEEFSELDAVVAAVDASIALPVSSPSAVKSPKKDNDDEPARTTTSTKRSSSHSPGPTKVVGDYAHSKSPVSSPGAIKAVRDNADPKTPTRQHSKSSKSSSRQHKIKGSRSEDKDAEAPQRRKSNDNLVRHTLQTSAIEGTSMSTNTGDDSSGHRRMIARRRSSNDSDTGTDTGAGDDSSGHRRAGWRRSSDSSDSSRSPGTHIRATISEDTTNMDDSSVHRRLARRRSNDSATGSGDDVTKNPGKPKQQHRRSTRTTSDEGKSRATADSQKQHHRSSSSTRTTNEGNEGTATADSTRSPGGQKQHRQRRGPSRSISRSTPSRTKSSSRPQLPSTLEEELSKSAAARNKTNKRSPHHKMPQTMEEELLSVASAPLSSRRKTRMGDNDKSSSSSPYQYRKTSTSKSYEDDDERSIDGEELDQLETKNRSKLDSSVKYKLLKSRSQKSRLESNEECLGELRGDPTNENAKPTIGSSENLNFMFEDSSSNFERTINNNSAGSSSAFDNDAFGASFSKDFGSFSEGVKATKPTRRTGGNDDSNIDPFGFSSSELIGGGRGQEAAPSFGNGLEFGGDWKPQTVYDKSPIEKPPSNHVESLYTKIKWITPRPNMVVASSPENQNPSPVANPLNGNLIVCRPAPSQTRSRSCDIVEWCPQRQTQVLATSILTTDLKRKVVLKYGVIPEAVDTVWTVSAGVHRTSDNTEALRVAALIDLTILGDRSKEVLRLIAVWNWGHSSGDTEGGPRLQSILSPPSGSDFTYDTKSLKVADGCIFVAGASEKGPCVFLNKPTVRETWSANFIAKNTDLRISSMAVTNAPKSPPDPVPTSSDNESSTNDSCGADHRLPYLAVALNDGSLSVWTYEAATKLTGKTKEAVRKVIFPLCRLHALKVLQGCPVTAWSSMEKSDSDKTPTSEATELGICTHLEWIPYRASAHKQLLLLAATFQGALCLYHVALPKIQDKTMGKKGFTEIKPPTEKTSLSQTISLRPFCFSKWMTTHHRASCAFVDLGPHVPPSLVVLVRGSHDSPDYARMALVTCPMQTHLSSHKSKSPGNHLSFHVWDTQEWNNKKASNLPRGLIHSSLTSTRGILYYTDTAVQELEYRTNTRFPLGASGAGSMPCGLTTSGGNYWADSKASSGVGVLSLYTTYHSERFKSALSHDPTTPTLLEFTVPGRRHWLVQTLAGDSKDSKPTGAKKGGSKGAKKDDEVVMGGAQSTLVCELVAQSKIQNLYPYRFARNPYSSMDQLQVAIWFRSLYGLTDPKSIGLVEKDGDGRYGVVQLVQGRDAVFLPPVSLDGDSAALVVSSNGGSISLWKRTKTSEALASPWKKDSSSKPCRPILGVDPKDEESYVELRQYVSTRFQNQLSLVAIASGSDSKFCLIAGALVEEDGLGDWSKLLPNMKENPVLWFEEREQISLVVPLPGEGGIKGGLGVATTQRILIVSPNLKILAAVDSEMPPGSLVPMGSLTIAYCSPMDHKLRYLSGLPSQMGRSGVIANFPVSVPSFYTPWLVGIRPDRFLYNFHQNGTRLVERGQAANSFLLPLATTRPALLLEPMLANAIATGGKDAASQPFLKTILEKFGRKVATMSHGENEGIGNSGAGITPRVFELLEHYDLKSAASWLLTGTVRFDRSANSRLLPSYLPVVAKAKGAFDADTHIHLIASGDQYFTEYVKSPDNNMSSTLPRPSDPTAALCRQFGRKSIQEGNVADAMKMLDISGTQSSDATILQLAMALQLDPSKDTQAIIDALYQHDYQTGKIPSAVASLAALASELRKGTSPSLKFHQKWLQSLAPSVQRSRKGGRHRSRLLGESSLSNIAMSPKIDSKLFSKELPESKLVWNEGPNGEKENLLMLDNIGEWLGRNRPIVFGKEGAKRAEERGASTLAGILHSNDDDSFGGENEDDFKDGWVDGVGDGLKDDDKLSAYYRFSEGEDEDPTWQDEGIADITKFSNTAVVIGNPDCFSFEESKSSVDEGESGKVKALYDLVFGQSGVGQASALAIPAARGGSLDLGVMHGPENGSRKKCTMEFWVWVPESIKKEIILVRRTFGSSAGDFDTVCKASDKSNFLWELGLHKSGELEFRTIAGKSLKTKPEKSDDTPTSSVHFSRWNHICIVMKQDSITSSAVSLIVRGTRKTNSKSLSFSPPGFEVDDFSGASALDPELEKSHLLYGLDHPKGFRMTELRVWALERKDDDIKTLMNEYLECAEIKRKFRIKIKKKSGGEKAGKIGLSPPKSSGLLSPSGGLRPLADTPTKGGLLAPPGAKKAGLLAPPKSSSKEESLAHPEISFGPSGFGTGSFEGFESPRAESSSAPVSFGSDGFGSTFESNFKEEAIQSSPSKRPINAPFEPDSDDIEMDDETYVDEEEIEISPLWESAIPLSKQVRTSAASALIRGPPATRHFGGNRGGLPDYRELERFGVGAISICGSEKTIVWRDDQVPPGLTYPIGASGAIVSDQMDGDGSEFLCCFMAKDKRMVVFELSTRTIVVELQMTTKLNYWRFLPPEAGEDTLCFMLITPVGGFHWMPLDESPRPRQVWKRGPELQGKKIVSYEEGGTNGYEGQDMLSKVGLVLVTDSADMVGGGSLEAWLVPVCGDSRVVCASYEILGACLCQPPGLEYEAFMPLLLFVVEEKNELVVCVSAVTQEGENSIGLTDVMTDALIEQGPYSSFDFEPPSLAMGTYPEILCCSLGTTVVVIVRRKGLVVAYELADSGLELIAQENVGHYVVDAVMRYNASEGGAEIVLLMGDAENRRDGRVGTFCFRPAV